ncbi:hypothetical protein J31TS4_10110 [Paenibacillus sp. J31TS4]|uniref:family 10 glycosylhydrolase n=1 Tax=Paenibacillus sp. J31TS4 TaxID=2807195 RepID=UPI001B157AE8|nr:family 10 glycosylhydrolase [Paenibacillus sp. J31TS4]GIP37731.1 hypothetical protein J31TS4_10110 [Paenibacillus sp. J31TS4]
MTRRTRKHKKTAALCTALILMLGTFMPIVESALTGARAMAAGTSPVSVEEFEELAHLSASSARAKSVKQELTSRPAPVRYGYHAVKLAYDFIGTEGTSAAYLNFADPAGSAGRTLDGYPKKLGLWVYGDGNNHWLRAQLQDAAGSKPAIDFTSSSGLSWTGWKYVTASVPSGLQLPIKLNNVYVAETKDTNKNAGALYFDRLRSFYTASTVFGIDVEGLGPMQTGETRQAQAYATYQDSKEPVLLASGVTFASSQPDVASIDGSGVVRALKPGKAVITASSGDAPQGAYEVTVTAEAPVPARLEIAAPTEMTAGDAGRLRVYAAYAGAAEPVEVTKLASFASSSPETATVDTAGSLRAVKAGTTTLSASFGGVSALHPLTVRTPVPVLQSIEMSGLGAMKLGESRQAKVLAAYTLTDGPVDVTASTAYKSSDPAIASIDSSGKVIAHQIGTTRITATYGGKTSDSLVIVNKELPSPKRELRAAWIASVENIDWPKKGVTDPSQQRSDFIKLLDDLKGMGMNAVVVQIKPTADAFYPSKYGPWSQWLTGVQGKDPGYDPLAFMIEEAHKRNLEFHGWFNPYRISMNDKFDQLVADHPARQHPDWVVTYGGKIYYNPGVPEAQRFIVDGVMEVVNRYDIDGVHFDDYFYPYPVAGADFPDDAQYRQYGAGFKNKGDWRRHNVNTFIEELSREIKQAKSYVQFGISPFGIWRNKADDPTGSDTNGLRNYDDLFADTRAWIRQGWIDYITPQLYWNFGYSPAAYEKLVDWWIRETSGTQVQLYIGQAPYRIGSGTDPAWNSPDEMPNQLTFNRNFPGVKGSTFFSAKDLLSNPLGFADKLKTSLYAAPALIPPLPSIRMELPQPVQLAASARGSAGIELTWEDNATSTASYYVIYRFEGEAAGSIENASSILTTVRKSGTGRQTWTDRGVADGVTYTYVVTAVNRAHGESAPSKAVTLNNRTDGTPPVTQLTLQGTERSGWYVSDVTITLQAADVGSGVKLTEYNLDGGASWQPYTAPFSLTVEGRYSLSFRSADAAGNVEPIRTVELAIDKTGPVVRIEGNRTYTVDQTVRITCTATDAVSGVVYDPCTSPLVEGPAYKLGLGKHTVQVTAADAAGHTTEANASYQVTVTDSSLLALIREWLEGLGDHGIANSLLKKAEHGQWGAFQNEVLAQRGKKIPAAEADLFLQLVRSLP